MKSHPPLRILALPCFELPYMVFIEAQAAARVVN
jgi:hypothetical protein